MRLEVGFVINRPIDQVWEAFVSDLPFNLPRARGSTLRYRQTSPGPPGLGSTFEQRVVILGMETQLRGVYTEWTSPRSIAFSVKGAGLRSGSVRATLEAVGDTTKIVIAANLEPRPAFKPLWWIAGPFVKRRSRTAFDNMKRLLESGPGRGGRIE